MELSSKLAFLLGVPDRLMRVEFKNYSNKSNVANRLRGLSFVRSNMVQYMKVYTRQPENIFHTENHMLNEYLTEIELKSGSLEEMYREVCKEIFELLPEVFEKLEIPVKFKRLFLQDLDKLELKKSNWELNSTRYRIFFNNVSTIEFLNIMEIGSLVGDIIYTIKEGIIYIDCNNFDVGKVYSVLISMNISSKVKIRLYVDGKDNKEWECLSELIDNSELIEVDNIVDYKSQVDYVITSDIATYSGDKYLMSSDSDFSILQDLSPFTVFYDRKCTSLKYISKLGDKGVSIDSLKRKKTMNELYTKLYLHNLNAEYHKIIDNEIRKVIPDLDDSYNIESLIMCERGSK